MPRRLVAITFAWVAALAGCRAGAEAREGVAPGEAPPITDREATRAPADRRPIEREREHERLIRDHKGIPIPAGSAAATARTGSSNPPREEAEGEDEGIGSEPIAGPDEGEAEPEE